MSFQYRCVAGSVPVPDQEQLSTGSITKKSVCCGFLGLEALRDDSDERNVTGMEPEYEPECDNYLLMLMTTPDLTSTVVGTRRRYHPDLYACGASTNRLRRISRL